MSPHSLVRELRPPVPETKTRSPQRIALDKGMVVGGKLSTDTTSFRAIALPPSVALYLDSSRARSFAPGRFSAAGSGRNSPRIATARRA
jgi:hypothetical protein